MPIKQNKEEYLRLARKNRYKENKEEVQKRNLEYYHENKDRINKKITCECNGQYSIKNRAIHCKTRLHQIYLKKLKEQHNDSETSNDSDSSD